MLARAALRLTVLALVLLAQPRATYQLIFNAIFHRPSTAVPAAQMGRTASGTNEHQ